MTDRGPYSRYDGPQYVRLLAAARRSVERTGGSLTATVTVNHPDDAERKAIIGITGQYRAEGSAQIGVRLADLDRAIREADRRRAHRTARTDRSAAQGPPGGPAKAGGRTRSNGPFGRK